MLWFSYLHERDFCFLTVRDLGKIAFSSGSDADATGRLILLTLELVIFSNFLLLFWASLIPRREESFPAVIDVLQEFRRQVTQNFGFLRTNADQADVTDGNPISNHDDSET
jgi:hypothetical protein